MYVFRRCQSADIPAHGLAQFGAQVRTPGDLIARDHVYIDTFAFKGVGHGNHSRFAHLGAGGQHGFYFGGGKAMAGNVDGVVNTAEYPEVAVLVDFGGVARRIAAEARKIGLVLLFIIEDALHHARPGAANDKMARLAACFGFFAVACGRPHNGGVNTGQRL